MSFEYDVPYVDFVTAFGKDDGADKFFDINIQCEKLSIHQTPAREEKKPQTPDSRLMHQTPKSRLKRQTPHEKQSQEINCRAILQEIPANVQNTEGSLVHGKVSQNPSECVKSVQGATKSKCNVNNEEKSQKSINTVKSIKSSVQKKHIETLEEVDGKLQVKSNEIKDTGVPRTIPTVPTRPVFPRHSFERRQNSHVKKREELIRKVLEEEKKNREFHAKPIPNYLMSKRKTTATYKTTKSCLESNTKITFRARPAYVIRRQPFLPKKPERSAIKISNVVLHTEERAKARKEFEVELKQHYKEQEMELEARKKLKEEKEMEEIIELRKKLVHKARPVPHFKLLVQQSVGQSCSKSSTRLKK